MHDPSYSPSGANVTPMAIYVKYDKITYAYPIYLRLKKTNSYRGTGTYAPAVNL